MKKLLMLSIVAVGMTMASCGDDESGIVIELTSPTEGQIFAAGDAISVTGTVTDDVEITAITIAIDQELLPTESIDISGLTDKSNIAITGQSIILNSATPAGTYNFTMTATDNEANVESATRAFSVE